MRNHLIKEIGRVIVALHLCVVNEQKGLWLFILRRLDKMANETLYKKAVAELFHRTYGKLEDRDVTVAVELFDLLLERDKSIHCDTLRELCEEVGYHESTSRTLARIYDFVDVYRKYKEGHEMRRWNEEMIDNLLE